MINLDFAILNMMETDKKGLVYQKFILDKLAPWFFSPRVEKLIDLNDVDAKGCKLVLPLGQGNWDILEKETKQQVLDKSNKIMQQYALNTLAVDRRLKKQFHELSNIFPMVFGDNFIKALTIFYIEKTISKKDIKRIIIAGILPELDKFIEKICEYGIPVSMQNYYPTRYELFAYRLLYEKGIAVSTSYITPSNWEKGDLIIIFESEYQRFTIASKDSFFLRLSHDNTGFSPDIENKLKQYGIDNHLYTLAPVLESCLLSKAGINYINEENTVEANNVNIANNSFQTIKHTGDELGIWELFLDKGI